MTKETSNKNGKNREKNIQTMSPANLYRATTHVNTDINTTRHDSEKRQRERRETERRQLNLFLFS